MQELAVLSEQSQHPKAYEVLSIHIKTMVEANKELLNLRKINQEITGNVNHNTLNTSTNIGTVFVGSTNDLQKMMADIKAKTIDG